MAFHLDDDVLLRSFGGNYLKSAFTQDGALYACPGTGGAAVNLYRISSTASTASLYHIYRISRCCQTKRPEKKAKKENRI